MRMNEYSKFQKVSKMTKNVTGVLIFLVAVDQTQLSHIVVLEVKVKTRK